MDGVQALEVIEALTQYGKPGVFLASLITNAIPGFPAFYLALVTTYAAILKDPLIIVPAGLGAAAGKYIIFAVSGMVGSRIGRVRRMREEASPLLKATKGSLAVTVLLVAALPIPDDIVYIPLGVASFNSIVFLAAVAAGKLVLTSMAYVLGIVARGLVDAFIIEPQEISLNYIAVLVVVSVAASLVATAVMISINWGRVYEAYNSEGGLKALRTLLSEVLGILAPRYRS